MWTGTRQRAHAHALSAKHHKHSGYTRSLPVSCTLFVRFTSTRARRGQRQDRYKAEMDRTRNHETFPRPARGTPNRGQIGRTTCEPPCMRSQAWTKGQKHFVFYCLRTPSSTPRPLPSCADAASCPKISEVEPVSSSCKSFCFKLTPKEALIPSRTISGSLDIRCS